MKVEVYSKHQVLEVTQNDSLQRSIDSLDCDYSVFIEIVLLDLLTCQPLRFSMADKLISN